MLDPAARQITVGGVPVHLTRTEYALCPSAAQNPGRVLSKSAILERISRDTPGLHGGFPEAAHEQPPQKAAGSGGTGVH